MVAVTSVSRYVTPASRYQNRSSMYIQGLISRNWPRQFPLLLNNCKYVFCRNITEIGARVDKECIDAGKAALLNVSIYNASGNATPILSYYVEPVTEYWE